MSIKSLIKKIIPKDIISAYHYSLAYFAAFYYRFPSEKMIVIGITGTKGKTSTANFIWGVLNQSGHKVGLISTANIKIDQQEFLNKYHMTMPGRFVTQRLMKEMVKAGCRYCVAEVTSEGVKQWRHKGINYDVAVFTGLTPEHLQAHEGSFEEYKRKKGEFFASLYQSGHKSFEEKLVPKLILVNHDSEHRDFFLNFWADKKITFGTHEDADIRAEEIETTADGESFRVNEKEYKLKILGAFNVQNALPAIALGKEFQMTPDAIQKGLADIATIPGRMEKIDEGQDFTVIVDYAHEKESMTAVLETAQKIKNLGGQTIILLGAEGGGRDKAKRPIMGELAGQKADFVIVSNVDPYEDDPVEILEDIAKASEAAGKTREKNLFVIADRREGIKKALSLAKKDDVVLITGKGAEQSIVIGGVKSPWDDRVVVREELKNRLRSV